MPTRLERIEGLLVGLLVGDALGVPYEFKSPSEIPARRRASLQGREVVVPLLARVRGYVG